MRLSELNPEFVDAGGPGVLGADGAVLPRRTGVMLAFDCPVCGPEKGAKHGGIMCYLSPAIDGTPYVGEGPKWTRTGDTFDTLTLSPSILNRTCGAHFYIRNGEIVQA